VHGGVRETQGRSVLAPPNVKATVPRSQAGMVGSRLRLDQDFGCS
jgi:hypothetical protein